MNELGQYRMTAYQQRRRYRQTLRIMLGVFFAFNMFYSIYFAEHYHLIRAQIRTRIFIYLMLFPMMYLITLFFSYLTGYALGTYEPLSEKYLLQGTGSMPQEIRIARTWLLLVTSMLIGSIVTILVTVNTYARWPLTCSFLYPTFLSFLIMTGCWLWIGFWNLGSRCREAWKKRFRTRQLHQRLVYEHLHEFEEQTLDDSYSHYDLV